MNRCLLGRPLGSNSSWRVVVLSYMCSVRTVPG